MFSKAKSGGKGQDTSTQANSVPEKPQIQPIGQTGAGGKRSAMSRSANVPSIISSDVVMRGNLQSGGEIQFDGTLEGDIKAASLIIGEQATVKGEVICETVTVRGRVEGGIRAKSVSLASTAHIQGDILHSSLSVETGAHFEGNCRHSDDPLSESSAKDFRRSRPSSPTPAPAPRPASAEMDENTNLRAANETSTPSFLGGGSRSPLR